MRRESRIALARGRARIDCHCAPRALLPPPRSLDTRSPKRKFLLVLVHHAYRRPLDVGPAGHCSSLYPCRQYSRLRNGRPAQHSAGDAGSPPCRLRGLVRPSHWATGTNAARQHVASRPPLAQHHRRRGHLRGAQARRQRDGLHARLRLARGARQGQGVRRAAHRPRARQPLDRHGSPEPLCGADGHRSSTQLFGNLSRGFAAWSALRGLLERVPRRYQLCFDVGSRAHLRERNGDGSRASRKGRQRAAGADDEPREGCCCRAELGGRRRRRTSRSHSSHLSILSHLAFDLAPLPPCPRSPANSSSSRGSLAWCRPRLSRASRASA